ncbi:hypothetical protein J3998_01490 [Thiomicrorhabdus sp. 6S2-11]|uniref:Lipoprotein n=1 Tax=Thiomicrorhabdus marina TaxID=2818442 RepID=A0ABS3Q1P1_9GAMM|nr:hypothetical protein [Thiomicrorhabdus marina]MBO1926235.1 hypothetical protein [Thiomicrorhabdus marina]
MTHKKLTGSALFTALLSSILTGCGGGGETAVISLQEPVDYINIAELGSDLLVDINLSNIAINLVQLVMLLVALLLTRVIIV